MIHTRGNSFGLTGISIDACTIETQASLAVNCQCYVQAGDTSCVALGRTGAWEDEGLGPQKVENRWVRLILVLG